MEGKERRGREKGKREARSFKPSARGATLSFFFKSSFFSFPFLSVLPLSDEYELIHLSRNPKRFK